MSQNFDKTYGDVKIALVYINDDDIPEALIEQEGNMGWDIITYDSGNAIHLVYVTDLVYKPKGSGFYNSWSDGEEWGTDYYIMKGTNVSTSSEKELGDEYIKNCKQFNGIFYASTEEALRHIE